MDMCNGEILSYGIDKHPSAMNVMNALNKAIEVTSDCPYRRTFHSDQGWAYQMKAYSHRLKEEMYYGVIYYSFEELKSAIEKYINYNENELKKSWVG